MGKKKDLVKISEFYNKELIGSRLVIKDGIEIIDTNFFRNSIIKDVIFPKSLKVIDFWAFDGCKNIIDLILNEGLEEIGNFAFQYDTGLSSITIPASVTSVGASAFDGCTGLEYVIFEATVPPTLGTSAFQQTNDCPIYVPDESVLAYQTATNYTSYSARIKGISNKPQ